MILERSPEVPDSLVADMLSDEDFQRNSRRVRLETLANYCGTALTMINMGAGARNKKVIKSAPDLTRLTGALPGLEESIQRRWKDAQKCQYVGAHLAAVVLMGSILEALLLARAQSNSGVAYRAAGAPKLKNGKNKAIPSWNLHELIEVAVEVGWLKSDRGKFCHALRESRNVVHPWAEVTSRANFDEATCKTCWQVLKASVSDLLA